MYKQRWSFSEGKTYFKATSLQRSFICLIGRAMCKADLTVMSLKFSLFFFLLINIFFYLNDFQWQLNLYKRQIMIRILIKNFNAKKKFNKNLYKYFCLYLFFILKKLII